MELKGKSVEKLSLEKKIKMEETLKRMEKIRQEDDRFLRTIIEEKLKRAKELKEKGLEIIQKNQIEVLKLGAIIAAFEEILITKNTQGEKID